MTAEMNVTHAGCTHHLVVQTGRRRCLAVWMDGKPVISHHRPLWWRRLAAKVRR